MDTILVAGLDSVVGANLAAGLADRCRIVGLSLSASAAVAIEGCEAAICPAEDPETVRQWVASVRPGRIVYCGTAARSSWSPTAAQIAESQAVHAVENWARAAREFGCRFTLVSSDAVFTGPWMFHTEASDCFCDSPQARAIRAVERRAAEICPAALVVRTNAYGWSPAAAGAGWIETLLADLEAGTCGPFDALRHATPILATDLAEIVVRAWQEELEGLYHIAGGERVSPCRFVERLADEFDLDAPLREKVESLTARPTGFGRGETSLHTKKVRKALCVAMPMLLEGLTRLREQTYNGYCERLNAAPQPAHGKVA